MISPAEVQAAILAVIKVGRGASRIEIPVEVARLLGFKTTSAQLRCAIETQVSNLEQQKLIVERNGLLQQI